MGLDMFLEARRYLSSYDENDEKKSNLVASVFPELNGIAKPTEINTELMYWRKANAIHKWFVDNVQNGEDDCQKSSVQKEDLQHLYNIIEQVLKDNNIETAMALLPPQSGFFFGPTEIDEWYWENLEKTKEALEKILAADLDGWHIYYQASW